MKTPQLWRLGMGDVQILHGARHRPPLKRPMWIIILVSMVSLFLVCAYIYPPQSSSACYVFSSRGCKVLTDWLPPAPTREFTDEEIASRIVVREILNTPSIPTKKAKIAFMFLTTSLLPFEKLWDKFFSGHEDRFSVYVHASKEKPVHVSRYFVDRDVRSDQVIWGQISMIDAERRLLANALGDPDNQHFVLLSDSCVPLYKFDHIYNYLMYSNMSYLDCFYDPGPHGNGRYSEHMLPEIELKDFRKGAQIVDPGGIANWSVTHVDWSERKWHPKLYRTQDITSELLKNITSIDLSIHVTSDEKVQFLKGVLGTVFFYKLLADIELLSTTHSHLGFSLNLTSCKFVNAVTLRCESSVPQAQFLCARATLRAVRDGLDGLEANRVRLIWVGLIKREKAAGSGLSAWVCYCAVGLMAMEVSVVKALAVGVASDGVSAMRDRCITANTKSRLLVHRHSTSPPFNDSKNDAQSILFPDNNIFLVNFSVGEPAVPQLAAMDNGSDLTRVQCTGCIDRACHKMVQEGVIIATEHLQFETPDEDTIIITEVMFGCGLVNIRKGTGQRDGVFGLGDSVVYKLGSRFSYCIGNILDPSYSFNRLTIGEGVTVEGYSTPYETDGGSHYITLEGIG
ncbi:hypothetical protein NC651_015508 [Populus alba x Populus x berolinensis]|nr:hypothetical protein NC651_015508 [Populus alba x Populus x berolinensis]